MTNFQKIKPGLMIVYAIVVLGLIGFWGYSQFFREQGIVETISEKESGTLDFDITNLENKILTNPKDADSRITLASKYIQKLRETADTNYYAKVDEQANEVIRIDPKRAEPYALLGEVAAGRHDFIKARDFAKKAIELNPNKALYLGLLADALLELGEYDQAVSTLQKMTDLRPDYSSFTRIAYARELHGEIEGAKDALNRAIAASSSYPENIAWAYVELGKLELRSSTDKAKDNFEKALKVFPDYAPAFEGLGRVAFAQKDHNQAIKYFEAAFNQQPIAQYATNLADIYSRNGNKEKQAQYLALAKAAYDQSTNSGVNTDLEKSLFFSEHDLELELALDLAQKSYKVRPSIYGAGVLAWALYKNGKANEALQYSQLALRLGEHDPLIVYHANLIEKANGNLSRAQYLLDRAYQLNPNFSILYAKD